MGWSFNYISITNNVAYAKILDDCGIQQIMVDTEIIGKNERQAGRNTIISDHTINDVGALKKLNLTAEIICRINPFHTGTYNEIEEAISLSTDAIMVPMIQDIESYRIIINQVKGRCKVIPLIETPYSVFKLNDIIEVGEIDQIHFGLNDLYLALGMKNLFEILLSPVFAAAIDYARKAFRITGFGGIGDPFEKQSVNPIFLLNEHIRLGSQSVILSRSFFKSGYDRSQIIKSLAFFEDRIKQGYMINETKKLKDEIGKM